LGLNIIWSVPLIRRKFLPRTIYPASFQKENSVFQKKFHITGISTWPDSAFRWIIWWLQNCFLITYE